GSKTWHQAGVSAMRLYPQDILGELRAWAGQNQLIVQDQSESLPSFFSLHRIKFLDDPERHSHSDGSLILSVQPDSPGPKIVYRSAGSERCSVVGKRLVEELKDSPPAQQRLLEIVSGALQTKWHAQD